jgi:hypothetical protein
MSTNIFKELKKTCGDFAADFINSESQQIARNKQWIRRWLWVWAVDHLPATNTDKSLGRPFRFDKASRRALAKFRK